MSVRNSNIRCYARRETLKNRKPTVYQKMFGIGDDIRAGKSNPIIQLQYNYRCNFSCEHCSIAPFRIVQNRRSLTPADVKAIFDQADEMGFARAVITGGEPLIFPDLSAVISAIGPERFYISIDTNGYYLTSAVVGWLKDKLVDRVQLSIDSFYAEEHDAFRRKRLSYAKAVNGLKECLRQKLDVFISTVVTKERLYSDEFKNFLEWGAEMGVDIFVTFAKPVGAWAGREDVMIDRQDLLYMRSLESRYRVFTHLTPAYGIDMGCIAVKGMISVTQYGDVQPCPYMHISLGNIFQEPLAKIVERGLSTKQFGERVDTCPIATDAEFLAKYNRITKDLE